MAEKLQLDGNLEFQQTPARLQTIQPGFRWRTPGIWNSIRLETRKMLSLSKFKMELRKWLNSGRKLDINLNADSSIEGTSDTSHDSSLEEDNTPLTSPVRPGGQGKTEEDDTRERRQISFHMSSNTSQWEGTAPLTRQEATEGPAVNGGGPGAKLWRLKELHRTWYHRRHHIMIWEEVQVSITDSAAETYY